MTIKERLYHSHICNILKPATVQNWLLEVLGLKGQNLHFRSLAHDRQCGELLKRDGQQNSNDFKIPLKVQSLIFILYSLATYVSACRFSHSGQRGLAHVSFVTDKLELGEVHPLLIIIPTVLSVFVTVPEICIRPNQPACYQISVLIWDFTSDMLLG